MKMFRKWKIVVDLRQKLNDNFQSCKFWNAVTKTFDTKNIKRENLAKHRQRFKRKILNEGCTLEGRKNIGNPTPL